MRNTIARRPGGGARLQAAVDFMVSYGIALLILAVAIYVVLSLGVFGGGSAPTSCYPAPSFSCDNVFFSRNGIVTIIFTQALGGTINVTGAACSLSVNAMGDWPQYGNKFVQSNTLDPQFYTGNGIGYGLVLHSGSTGSVSLPCYTAGGAVAATNLGTSFSGYVWFNYTYANLPTKFHNVEEVAQFTATAG